MSHPDEAEAFTRREGVVAWGVNNIYTVRIDDGDTLDHVRIKGKVLDDADARHNPIAPGDRVAIESGAAPLISRRLPRRNELARWNRKTHRVQVIAANVDRVVVVASCGNPPYKHHFVDRVIAAAEAAGIEVVCVVNKADLDPGAAATARHRSILAQLGYAAVPTVAIRGTDDPGVRRVSELVERGVTVLFGQSGVGKSSLINALVPEAGLRTAQVSRATRHGRHTTTRAILVESVRGALIDTPGVRELDLRHLTVDELAAGFREFRPLIPECRYPGCTHLHEPGCAVIERVAAGEISRDRYESYRRLARESTLGGAT